MELFACKCCKILKAENEHLRKWIDRLMDRNAPKVEEPVLVDPRLIPDEDVLFQTQEV